MHSDIKVRIFQLGISQERVALTAGYDPTLFSRILNGIRPTPPDFVERVNATLDKLEAAERAANEATHRPIGYLRLRPLQDVALTTARHLFEVAELRPADGPMLQLPTGPSRPAAPTWKRNE